MGLKRSYIDFINQAIQKTHGDNFKNLKMLELGDQVIKKKSGIKESTGKLYYQSLGVDHISVDLNGQRGSLVKDLTNPEEFSEFHNYFDVVTNSGTSEHVEPFESQYECFKIMHDSTKINGVIIHLVPDVEQRDMFNRYIDHCKFYYSMQFFKTLQKICDYDMISLKIIDGLVCAALIKKQQNFNIDRETFLSGVNIRWEKNYKEI